MIESKDTQESPWIVDMKTEAFKQSVNEDGKEFFNYITMLNLKNGQTLIVLPSAQYYYYDHEELRKVKMLVQVKELNKLSDINKFFTNLNNVISDNTKLIGCFKDNNIFKDIIFQRNDFVNWLVNKMNVKPNHFLSQRKVIKLFQKYNLKIVDISVIEGLTYFCVRK